MTVITRLMTKNPCYTAGRKITVKGLMLHSVGCPQPKAMSFIRAWDKVSYKQACVHGFIDGDTGAVYQTLPFDIRGWHCGSGNKGSGNNTHIGIEMCEPACIKYTSGSDFTCSDVAAARAVAQRTYRAAVELFAMLCGKYGLDPLADGVIISHKEGHARGIASNHGDPEHLWSQLGTGYTMAGFRRDVYVKLHESEGTTGSSSQPSSATVRIPAVPFAVRVIVDDLNIRALPSMDGKIRGRTGKGVFTITATKDGWGYLKSGYGWIRIDNPAYCVICRL